MTSVVIAEFFENEFNEYVRNVLQERLSEGAAAYLTFNIFNVRLDPEAGTATIEDELDPDRQEEVDLDVFRRLVEEAAVP